MPYYSWILPWVSVNEAPTLVPPADEGLTDDSQTFILLYGKGFPPKMPIFMAWENIGPTRVAIQSPY